MESTKRVAIVTGSNKGIGFAIVRSLCKQYQGDVFLTARNENLGKSAVAELEKEGLKPKFHQLDITDEQSVVRLAQHFKSQYGGIDLLVNNAGMTYPLGTTAPLGEQAEVTVRTNYFGTLLACKHLIPLVKPHGRIVTVSSTYSVMTLNKCSAELQQKLRSLKTIDEISEQMNDFVRLCKEGKQAEHGWPTVDHPYMTYGVSKIGVSLITPWQQQAIDEERGVEADIILNSCCPGYVATDLNGHSGTKTIDEGADTPVYLALLPQNATEPRGKFVSNRVVTPV